MSRVLTAMPAAALAMALLAGCGTETMPSAAPSAEKASPAADPHGKRRQMEAMRADCMNRRASVRPERPLSTADDKRGAPP